MGYVEAALSTSSEGTSAISFIDGDHTYDGLRGDWESWSGLVAGGRRCGAARQLFERGAANRRAGSVRYTRDVIRRDPRFEVVRWFTR